ncbi:MAG: DUF1905 domain-containing protein [Bacteroidetes bacterium]|nr:DUF1905 domain-containing protein [Bacteroidota bacterium]
MKYEFRSKVWQHPAPGGWHFISLPESVTKEIRKQFKSQEQGWGRLKITAQTGKSKWATAIWFDTRRRTYLLPLKKEIRVRERIYVGGVIDVIVGV